MELTINIPDPAYRELVETAKQRGESASQWLSRLALDKLGKTTTSDDEDHWPEGFLDEISGALADCPLERQPQGEFEERLELL